MQYRTEIDGLRAVAVLPVVLFHAGFAVFSGGFVGVDIFFVISGYLITSILLADLRDDTFSILRFYERRARRILPALFFIILCSLPFAYLWMLPSELSDFAMSIIAVIFFVSNVFFWQSEGYFSAASELSPLLHTWSLAVEEQFYFLFPILLFLFRKRSTVFVSIALLSMIFVSLGLAEWGWRNAASANFYLAPTRAFELLVGSLCAIALMDPNRSFKSNAVSLLGMGMIVVSVFVFDEKTPFPSVYALVPVLGTAAIILCGTSETLVGRLLSFRIFVGTGLVSYSAYLWHQPIFAFARLRSLHEPSLWVWVVLITLVFALAGLTWKFIEQPFRAKTSSLSQSRSLRVLKIAGASSALLFAIGCAGFLSNGLAFRNHAPDSGGDLEARLDYNRGLGVACTERFTIDGLCATSSEPEILLWGDSFAMHLVPGLMAGDPDLAFQQHTKSRCAPILGVAQDDKNAWSQGCIAFNNSVLEWLEASSSVKVVVLSSQLKSILRSSLVLENGDKVVENTHRLVMERISATIERIKAAGFDVVFMSPTPNSGYDIGRCAARSEFFGGDPADCDFLLPQDDPAFEVVAGISDLAPIIWLDQQICDGSNCDVIQNGTLIYRDYGHLSFEGSAYLGQTYNWIGEIRDATR